MPRRWNWEGPSGGIRRTLSAEARPANPPDEPPPPRANPGRSCSKPQSQPAKKPKQTTRKLLEEEAEAGVKRSAKDITDEAKRAGRRRRTEMLDLALELSASWFRDLAATASGATEVVYNRDRLAELQTRAADLDPPDPAAPPNWSRTPAAASTSTSPRS